MKLSIETVQAVIEQRNQGRTVKELAHEVRIHESTLRRILRNYEVYGVSLWTSYPTDNVNLARP